MERGWMAVLLLALTGCSGGENSNASTQGSDESALRGAVQAYSDAYLTGDAAEAYALLSDRCQERMSRKAFAGLVSGAKAAYGTALPMKTFDADVQQTQARVTYTYDVPAIDQKDQPWVDEGGWKYDAC